MSVIGDISLGKSYLAALLLLRLNFVIYVSVCVENSKVNSNKKFL